MKNTSITTNKSTTSVLKAAWLISAVTILSKLVGFVRDIIIANYYGATLVSDAYFFAQQIPALAIILLGGVGGPFHSATVAVFSKLISNLSEKPSEKLNKLFNTFLTTTFILFTLFGLLCFFFSNEIMSIIIADGNNQLIHLASNQLKIMSPVILIGGIIGIYYGILISYKNFILPSISPIMISLATIIILFITGGDKSGYVLALAVTIGAICQLLLQVPKVRQIGFRIKPNFNIKRNPDFKAILELLFPAILSSTVGQIHIYIDMFFASTLTEGAWTAVGYANRIFQFPVGILVTAFLVPLFPIFSRLVAENKLEEIKVYFNKGVGVLFFAAFPIIIGILVLGLDGISLIFERGAFNNNATFMVTQALWFLSFSILPYVFRDSITRVYYSFNDSATPFVVAFSSIILKAFLNILLINKLDMGIAGITLSTSFVTLFNAIMLGLLISKKLKLNYKSLFINLLKMAISATITFVLCWIMGKWFNTFNLNKEFLEIFKICIIGTFCIIIYIGLNILFKMEYVLELKLRLLSKLKGTK